MTNVRMGDIFRETKLFKLYVNCERVENSTFCTTYFKTKIVIKKTKIEWSLKNNFKTLNILRTNLF